MWEVIFLQNLDNDIKSGNFKRVYLIYGEESFLVKEYERKYNSGRGRNYEFICF